MNVKTNETKMNFTKGAKYLIFSDLIFTITSLFADTFLVAYFLKITNENITQVALYYIIVKGIHGIGILLMGNFIKNKPKIRTKILSIGITFRALFILFISILGNNLANYYIIVAIFCSISGVLYWSTHELLAVDVTNNSNRQNYTSVKKILTTLAHIIAPIILGSTIELYSFTKIAIYIFILSVIQILVTMQIKPDKYDISNTDKYDIKTYIKELKENKSSKIFTFYLSTFIYGIIDDSMRVLVTIVTVMTFKTSLNLGILTTIFSLCSILTLYLYKKYYNKKNCKIILAIFSTLIVIGAIALVIKIDRFSLIIYNFACTVSLCVFDANFNAIKGNLIVDCNIEKRKVEHVLLSTFILSSARSLGFVLIFIVGLINNITIFKFLLLIMALGIPLYSKLICKLENNSSPL